MGFSIKCNCPPCCQERSIIYNKTLESTDWKEYNDRQTRQMKEDTDTRATAWSVTLYNGEEKQDLPEGWKLDGQVEKCPKTGKLHYQGFLKTQQVRFSTVKKAMPKAHIEKCRDEVALKKYVHKAATRVAAPRTGSLNNTKFFEDVFEYAYEQTDRQDMLTVAQLLHDVKTDGTASWLNETVACMIRAGATWDYAAKATDPKVKQMWIRFRIAFFLSWCEEREKAENESSAQKDIQDADDDTPQEVTIGVLDGQHDDEDDEGTSQSEEDTEGQDDSDSGEGTEGSD